MKKKMTQKNSQTFSDKVYAIVARIPKGKTMTYKEVAKKAGKPLAARAVGTLMKNNYNSKIPCHRVVRSDGKPSGYNRGGWNAKVSKLKKEGVDIS